MAVTSKVVARAVCAVALAVGCLSAVAYASQAEPVPTAAPEVQAVGELPPLTEDIYYQGSAAPANEPYFDDADRIVLDGASPAADLPQAA